MSDDDLAYGEYHGHGEEGQTGDRGFLGDTFHRIIGKDRREDASSLVGIPRYYVIHRM